MRSSGVEGLVLGGRHGVVAATAHGQGAGAVVTPPLNVGVDVETTGGDEAATGDVDPVVAEFGVSFEETEFDAAGGFGVDHSAPHVDEHGGLLPLGWWGEGGYLSVEVAGDRFASFV